MKKSLWLVLGLLSGCDWNWGEAETLAKCRRGDCDGGGVLGDAGFPDAGPTDVDAGGEDAGALDAGTADAGGEDAGALDAGTADAGALDAGASDAGPSDAGILDAGVVDAGVADAGTPDAGMTVVCAPILGLPPIPGGTGLVTRTDLLLSATGEAFGVAIDGETVWSVIKTADGGTEVYDACRLVYSGTNAPRAFHANGEVTRGLLLATGPQVLMITRDAGVLSSFGTNARLVALARDTDGGPSAFIWEANTQRYAQTTLAAPSLSLPLSAMPGSVSCSFLDLGSVDVLESAQGGTIVLTMNPVMCGTGPVADGLLNAGWQAQLISTAGTRSGFTMPVSSPTKVGRASDGLRFAYRVSDTQVGTYRPSDGGFGTFLTTGTLEAGSISGDLLSGIASGQLTVPFAISAPFTEPTAFLGTINAFKPIITVGASTFGGGISHVVFPDGGPTFVLWRLADSGVVLSKFE